MNCPKCRDGKSRVVRVTLDQHDRKLRRRECRECGHRWNTWEVGFAPVDRAEEALRKLARAIREAAAGLPREI